VLYFKLVCIIILIIMLFYLFFKFVAHKLNSEMVKFRIVVLNEIEKIDTDGL
jgi:hypothetical protein